jgi:hypothetical protein
MRQDPVTFPMRAKVVVQANTKPLVPESTLAFWRRIRLVPFTAAFKGENADKGLAEKLRAELPGILNWAIGGLRAWRSEHLGIPPEVEEAVATYRREAADVETFLEECCVQGPDLRVRGGDLWAAFEAWADAQSRHAVREREFRIAVAEKGFARAKIRGYWHWKGLALQETGGGGQGEAGGGQTRISAEFGSHVERNRGLLPPTSPLPQQLIGNYPKGDEEQTRLEQEELILADLFGHPEEQTRAEQEELEL